MQHQAHPGAPWAHPHLAPGAPAARTHPARPALPPRVTAKPVPVRPVPVSPAGKETCAMDYIVRPAMRIFEVCCVPVTQTRRQPRRRQRWRLRRGRRSARRRSFSVHGRSVQHVMLRRGPSQLHRSPSAPKRIATSCWRRWLGSPKSSRSAPWHCCTSWLSHLFVSSCHHPD